VATAFDDVYLNARAVTTVEGDITKITDAHELPQDMGPNVDGEVVFDGTRAIVAHHRAAGRRAVVAKAFGWPHDDRPFDRDPIYTLQEEHASWEW